MNRPVFSVQGGGHTSNGDPDLITYQTTHVNEADGWNGSSTFNAPLKGVYFFSITFVKDSLYHGGTTDDVRVHLRKNGQNVGSAWSGQGSTRSTGAYTAAIPLEVGDRVETFASSDGGKKRHIIECQFTGYMVSIERDV